eukprot:gnl/TRDRNA2_/TRDRNA2_33104_c0_seq1.p1 gnl/TRDRNA2_/TRDRNA2_33104_c0~~gnl/TRDRNA2_/TRDRNA2_33104_c0_seq1.p1  ORF type:complete len:242 (-),score=29.29 gnl/TRDRNA2_/TRDRNA2_33104_c0_seq1:34-759(-)
MLTRSCRTLLAARRLPVADGRLDSARSSSSAATAADSSRLWAPGAASDAARQKSLARAILGRVREHGTVDVDARGAASISNALHALACASRDGSRVAEFAASWETDGEVRWLRFRVAAGARWDFFAKNLGRLWPLTVVDKPDRGEGEPNFKRLAKAIKTSQKHAQKSEGTVVAQLPPTDVGAANVLAKALAELPRIAGGGGRVVQCVAVPASQTHEHISVYVRIGLRAGQHTPEGDSRAEK